MAALRAARPLPFIASILTLALTLTSAPEARADITIDLGRGPVKVHVPNSYDPNVPAPLIVLLHAYGFNSSWIKSYFDIDAMSEEYGFIYMAPDGKRNDIFFRFWNATDACCDFFGDGVDDSSYLRALVEEVQNQLTVAPRRIHFAGHSNGGFMSYRMACDHPDLVASVASMSGASWYDDNFCRRSEPAHALEIHATNDAIILYNGGDLGLGPYPSAPGSAQRWVDGNGCDRIEDDTQPNLDLDWLLWGDETEVLRWVSNCDSGGSSELWTIHGAGHFPNLSSKFPRLLVDWFMAHPNPGIWTDLGNGLAGTHGTPTLTPSGGMVEGEAVELQIGGARENSFGFLVIGFDEWYLDFAGGVLVPSLDIVVSGMKTNAQGELTLGGTWPQDLPPGFLTAYQTWWFDPLGPQGFSATNAVRGITP